MRRPLARLLGAALLLIPGVLRADGFGLCTGTEPKPCRGGLSRLAPLTIEPGGLVTPEPVARGESVGRSKRPGLVRDSALLFAGSLALTPFIWWHPNRTLPFHFHSEGWFDPETYAGGVDKASHTVGSYIGFQAAELAYRALGNTDRTARTLALANVSLMGLLIEVGDAKTFYGFSWEDLTADLAGVLAGVVVSTLKLENTVGFRVGVVPYSKPIDPEDYSGSFSKQIYTGDLKLAGFLPRLGVAPGPARFFLVSVTYAARGYQFLPPEQRGRLLGIELGLSLAEIARALGARGARWWHGPLLFVLESFRFPYTAIGVRYDFTGRRWVGPDSGER
jgi:hypothetical protein